MRVLVIANHDPALLGDQFEADVLAAGWRIGAPHCEVDSFVFSHCEPGMAAVWREHAAQAGGYEDTAFISGCEPEPQTPAAEFAQDLALQFHRAVASGMSRVVLALQSQNDRASDPVAQLVDVIAEVREFCAGVDVVAAYATNMPLLGMHGMSGAASLADVMVSEVAQEREKEISELFHRMQGPYNELQSSETKAGSLDGSAERRRQFERPDQARWGRGRWRSWFRITDLRRTPFACGDRICDPI